MNVTILQLRVTKVSYADFQTSSSVSWKNTPTSRRKPTRAKEAGSKSKKKQLTAGEEHQNHGEDSAHIKRRGSSSFPHNHPSSSGSDFTPLPSQTGLRKDRGVKLEPLRNMETSINDV